MVWISWHTWDQHGFREFYTSRNSNSLVWKGQRRDKMKDDYKGKVTEAKASEGGPAATPVGWEGGAIQENPGNRTVSPEHYSQALRPKRICPAALLTCFRPVTLYSFLSALSEWGCLSDACLPIVFWKQIICPVSQVSGQRYLCLREEYTRSLMTPAFDYLDSDTWDFLSWYLDEIWELRLVGWIG